MRQTGIEFGAVGEAHFVDLGAPPALKPTELLVVTEFSAMTNGTERHALLAEHGWPGGGRHGYQHVGRVVRMGTAVDAFKVGDRVFVGQYTGHRGWQVVDVGVVNPVGFLEPLVITLPNDLDPAACALMGVAGVALRGARRFRIEPAQRVWVAGQGLIGHFAAQAARALGARVVVSDIHPERLALGKQCGAHGALDASAPDFYEQLAAQGPFNCLIDACGTLSLLQDILDHRLLAYRGVIGLLAVRTETSFQWGMLHQTEASIEVSCHFGREDLRVLLHFMQQGTINIAPVITHTAPVDQAIDLYAQLRDHPASMLGVVFDWTQ